MTLTLGLSVFAFPLFGGDEASSNNPVELGKVSWQRDYEAAHKIAKTSGKPVLLLFQEVPG